MTTGNELAGLLKCYNKLKLKKNGNESIGNFYRRYDPELDSKRYNEIEV